MTKLKVNLNMLDAFSTAELNAAEGVGFARLYADSWLGPLPESATGTAGSQMWSTAIAQMGKAREKITANLDRLNEVAAGSAREIGRTAAAYRGMDLRHAQDIDDKHVGEELPDTSPHEGFWVGTSPLLRLKEPTADPAIPESISAALDLTSWLSLSHWVNKGIEVICGVNPAEYLAEKIGGDWEAFAKAGSAVNNLADYYGDYADNIEADRDVLFSPADGHAPWEGHAANGANAYYTKLVQSVKGEAAPLRDFASQMKVVADGVAQMTDALKSGLEDLMDYLITAGVALAAAGVSWETGVGPLIGGLAAGWEIYQAFKAWAKVVDAVDKAITVANTFAGAVFGLLGALDGMQDCPLPSGVYDSEVPG